MEILTIINSYIKYVYYILIIVIIVYLIKLFKVIRPVIKNIKRFDIKSRNIQEGVKDINIKKEKIQYTIDNSLPLFGFLFFAIVVVTAAIDDYRNTKISKRSFVKSTIKEYNVMNSKYKFNRSKKYRKVFLSNIKRFI